MEWCEAGFNADCNERESSDPTKEVAVNIRMMKTTLFGVCLGLAPTVAAQQAAPLPKQAVTEAKEYPMPALPNPALAQAIAQALKNSGQLSRYQVQVVANGGTVDLLGEVADESQRAIVIRIARSAPGIAMVRDWLQVRPDPAIVRTQAPLIPPLPLQPLPLPQQPNDKPGVGAPRVDGQLPEPMPIFQPMPGPNPMMQPPPMPPYAWPTVAPYNNYSRVAYPQAYSYEQWPFIGPMYPFPRVPLGWRSVSLTWEDGHWWYHRNPTGHDWWRIRYW